MDCAQLQNACGPTQSAGMEAGNIQRLSANYVLLKRGGIHYLHVCIMYKVLMQIECNVICFLNTLLKKVQEIFKIIMNMYIQISKNFINTVFLIIYIYDF